MTQSSKSAGRTPGHTTVHVLNAGLVPAAVATWVEIQLIALHQVAGSRLRRVTVQLVNDSTMQSMHAQHLNNPATTDVLSFVDGDEVDIAVCVDEAMRRCGELGHDLGREVLLYSLHGMLHAMGFDDRTPMAHARMHAEEDRLLGLVGIAATFAPKAGEA